MDLGKGVAGGVLGPLHPLRVLAQSLPGEGCPAKGYDLGGLHLAVSFVSRIALPRSFLLRRLDLIYQQQINPAAGHHSALN